MTSAGMTLEDRALLVEMASDLFTRTTPLMGRGSETDADLGRKIWRDVEKAELARVGVAVEKGGAGGSVADACAVLLRIGNHLRDPHGRQLAKWPLGQRLGELHRLGTHQRSRFG